MNSTLQPQRQLSFESFQSELFNNDTFYAAFARDLRGCHEEAIIESPFITLRRLRVLLPILSHLIDREVRIVVNTRNPLEENNAFWSREAQIAIELLQRIGVIVLYTVRHHRKLAIMDKTILWEGSLNILSYHDSCEVMRRTESSQLAQQMLEFIKLNEFVH